MPRCQGDPLTKDEIDKIQKLLMERDLSMTTIAERMNCTRSSITRINNEFQIRPYNGRRSHGSLVDESVGR